MHLFLEYKKRVRDNLPIPNSFPTKVIKKSEYKYI